MTTETTTGTGQGTAETAAPGTEVQTQEQQMVSAADVERIVKDRLAQQAKNKFGDYEALKAQAGQSATLDQRLATLEGDLTTSRAEALRARVAADYGISTKAGPNGEPSDADLFLTGSDADSLKAQAERLAGREADRQTKGNRAAKEGTTTTTGNATSDVKQFARQLFGRTD